MQSGIEPAKHWISDHVLFLLNRSGNSDIYGPSFFHDLQSGDVKYLVITKSFFWNEQNWLDSYSGLNQILKDNYELMQETKHGYYMKYNKIYYK